MSVTRELLISVVDDDDSFRTALIELLRSLGYGARGFTSAEEFVAADGEASSDCIITDIQMPGMSGFDLKRLLAARGSKVPVIMITARVETSLEARVSASGVVCLLRKPFEMDTLTGCLDKALRQ
jgi:FixJ family two-component response regulator